MPSRLKFQIIFFLVFCLPGLAVVGYSARLAASAIELAGSGLSETGMIVDYERQENLMRVGNRFCAVVEFRYDRKTHRFTDDWCNKSQRRYPAGSPVNVIFDATSPMTARINEFGALHGKSLLIGAIGAPWLLLGIALVLRVR